MRWEYDVCKKKWDISYWKLRDVNRREIWKYAKWLKSYKQLDDDLNLYVEYYDKGFTWWLYISFNFLKKISVGGGDGLV